MVAAESASFAEFVIDNKLDQFTIASDLSTKNYFSDSFDKFHQALSKSQRQKLFYKIKKSNIKIYYQGDYLKDIDGADYIFVTSGWIKQKANFPKLDNIYKNNPEKFITMTWLYLNFSKAKLLGITGSNGKSTTAHLLYKIIKSYTKIYFAGNDRDTVQLLPKLNKMKKSDYFLMEISDRQLIHNPKKSPNLSIITNIVPNHLDDHKTLKRYISVKKRIIDCQTNSDVAILNYDNQITNKLAKKTKSLVYFFSRKKILPRGCYLDNGAIYFSNSISSKKEKIIDVKDIKLLGNHNLENVMAASLAAKILKVPIKIIKKEIASFSGIRDRLELVGRKKDRYFYYDRQATTPEATIFAIDSFTQQTVLIVGGENKEMKYKKLANNIKKKVKSVILLPGSASYEISRELKKIGYSKIINVNNIKEALYSALKVSQKSDIVLLSPASVYAQLEYYGLKRKKFPDLVKELK